MWFFLKKNYEKNNLLVHIMYNKIQSKTKMVWTTAKNGVATDTTSNVQPI